jgi:hypothetical protein
MLVSKKHGMSDKAAPRNRHHKVSTNMHKKSHTTIHVHKGGKKKDHKKGTILK